MTKYSLIINGTFVNIELETYEDLMRKFSNMLHFKREITNTSDSYLYYNTNTFWYNDMEIILQKATLK